MTTEPTSHPSTHSPAHAGVRWVLATPTSAPAAIGIVALLADTAQDLDTALAVLGMGPIAPGTQRLVDLVGIDEGLVVRWSPTRADLFPHGGRAVQRLLLDALTRAGVLQEPEPSPLVLYPEAETELEARMLQALARDPSPRATDLLLAQPARWESSELDTAELAPASLQRLLHPPLVVALGRANIGKSSLANALARREAALVADMPGTTRDHVGLTLTLDGLTVRYLDTPGVEAEEPDPLTAQAASRATELAQSADLIVRCHDAGGSRTAAPPATPPGVPVLDVVLRADLGADGGRAIGGEAALAWPVEAIETSAAQSTGLDALAVAVRRALVPDADLADPRPWRFWQPA